MHIEMLFFFVKFLLVRFDAGTYSVDIKNLPGPKRR